MVGHFKCFDRFEMSNIGQINLIAGDNNIGKTSLLEALLLDTDLVQTLHNLNAVYAVKHSVDIDESSKRNYLAYFINNNQPENREIEYGFNNKSVFRILAQDIRLHEASVKEKFSEKYSGQNKIGEVVAQYTNNTLTDVSPAVYLPEKHLTTGAIIPNNVGYTSRIVKNYSRLINQDLSNNARLIKSLKLFIPEIEDIRLLEDQYEETSIAIQQKDNSKLLPITAFGDGALKMLRLMLRIMTSSNQRLMIDEIDTGVYYQRMKDYIKAIIVSAFEYNVQLFTTTHSKEFIEAYQEALFELGENYQQKSRYIILGKTKNNQIKSYVLNYAELAANIISENEIR
jgi:AAA15 family ATPase/GTPase